MEADRHYEGDEEKVQQLPELVGQLLFQNDTKREVMAGGRYSDVTLCRRVRKSRFVGGVAYHGARVLPGDSSHVSGKLGKSANERACCT